MKRAMAIGLLCMMMAVSVATGELERSKVGWVIRVDPNITYNNNTYSTETDCVEPYLYNTSGQCFLNDTMLNITIDDRMTAGESDPLWTANQTDYYNISDVDTLDTDTNTTMKAYVDAQDTAFNSSLKAYLDAMDAVFNNSLKAYLDAQDIAFNTSMKGYVDGLSFLTSESDPLWTGNQTNYPDISSMEGNITDANTTMKNYADAQDILFNNSLKAYLDAQDTAFNTSMKGYVDGLPDDDQPDNDAEVPDDLTITSTKYINTTMEMANNGTYISNGTIQWRMYVNASGWFIIEEV